MLRHLIREINSVTEGHAGEFRDAFGSDIFGHHESHLNTRLRVIPHEHWSCHRELLLGFICTADVTEQFHETAVAALSVKLSFR